MAAFKNVSILPQVVELDRHQAEYSTTFSDYLNNSISDRRIRHGKALLKKHTFLKKIEQQYGVQAQIIIALWAMESDFGQNMGSFSTINTLATLAYDGRRPLFFRNELISALHILHDRHIPIEKMKSSWAGAMGQPQFMPSTFIKYAADGNGDGKKDIWNNTRDVFASAAHYLEEIGWKSGQKWGFEVQLPKGFDPYQARLAEEKPLKEWNMLGVKKANGQQVPKKEQKGSVLLPSGINGPAFLVLHNFRRIREWNRSISYALTIGHLSDRLMGGSPLIGLSPQGGEKSLNKKQRLTLQSNLQELGFYKDKLDGMIGLKSRNAIREYQKSIDIPADGYPSHDLVLQVQKDIIMFRAAQ
ncbi:MAG: lytic murein transglycosylase [Candidatus Electrothrix sp. AR3]|nr:lytic murein transglycosylase [Candidatus Electrothrix sp. AR3]